MQYLAGFCLCERDHRNKLCESVTLYPCLVKDDFSTQLFVNERV